MRRWPAGWPGRWWHDSDIVGAALDDMRAADRPGAVPRGGGVPRRAVLRLDLVRLGRERQPALLGRRGGRRGDRTGPMAPPSMVSVWFRPHHWAPGRTAEALPLQVHFDLKAALGLPEAVMTDDTIEFHTPGAHGRRAADAPGAALGQRREDDQARHGPLLGHRRRCTPTRTASWWRSRPTRASATAGARRRHREHHGRAATSVGRRLGG